MLLSAATETQIFAARPIHNVFFLFTHFTSTMGTIAALVVVKTADFFPILSGLAVSSIDRDLCVTVTINSLGTNLRAGLLVSNISHSHRVVTATSPSRWGASSAGSSSRHVERLPCQVIRGVLVITCPQEFLRQTAITVEHGETRRLTSLCQLCFQIGDLEKKRKKERKEERKGAREREREAKRREIKATLL